MGHRSLLHVGKPSMAPDWRPAIAGRFPWERPELQVKSVRSWRESNQRASLGSRSTRQTTRAERESGPQTSLPLLLTFGDNGLGQASVQVGDVLRQCLEVLVAHAVHDCLHRTTVVRALSVAEAPKRF